MNHSTESSDDNSIEIYNLIDPLYEQIFPCELNIRKKKYKKHGSFHNIINGLKITKPKYTGNLKIIDKKQVKKLKYNKKMKYLIFKRQRCYKYNYDDIIDEYEVDFENYKNNDFNETDSNDETSSEPLNIDYGYCVKKKEKKCYSDECYYCGICHTMYKKISCVIRRIDIENFLFNEDIKYNINFLDYERGSAKWYLNNNFTIFSPTIPDKINTHSIKVFCHFKKPAIIEPMKLKLFDKWTYDKLIFWEICNYVNICNAFNFARTCTSMWSLFNGYILYRKNSNIPMTNHDHIYSIMFKTNKFHLYFKINFEEKKVYEYLKILLELSD